MRDAPLPDCSFAELAVELHMIACREAWGLEQLEIWATRSAEPVLERTVAEVRRNARLAASAAALMRALIPVEDEIRELIARAAEARQ